MEGQDGGNEMKKHKWVVIPKTSSWCEPQKSPALRLYICPLPAVSFCPKILSHSSGKSLCPWGDGVQLQRIRWQWGVRRKRKQKQTPDQNPSRGSGCRNEKVSKTRDGKANKQWGWGVWTLGEAAGVITGHPRGSEEDSRGVVSAEKQTNTCSQPGRSRTCNLLSAHWHCVTLDKCVSASAHQTWGSL